jgi:hypothetical protein
MNAAAISSTKLANTPTAAASAASFAKSRNPPGRSSREAVGARRFIDHPLRSTAEGWSLGGADRPLGEARGIVAPWRPAPETGPPRIAFRIPIASSACAQSGEAAINRGIPMAAGDVEGETFVAAI